MIDFNDIAWHWSARLRSIFKTTAILLVFTFSSHENFSQIPVDKLDIPDTLITEAYERAANVFEIMMLPGF